MADIRSIAGQSLVPQAQPVARSEAVRAAQRAFFQAALSGAPAPTAPIQTSPVSSPPRAQAVPGQILRPGSLVDIKV